MTNVNETIVQQLSSDMPSIQLDELTLGQVLDRIQDHAGLDMPLLVPTRARKRLGRLGRDLLSELIADMNADASEATLRQRVSKLQHFYAAVLIRDSTSEVDAVSAAETDPITAPDQWKAIRARLQLAEAGRWKELFAPLASQYAPTQSGTEEAAWVPVALHGPESSAATHAKRKLAAASKVKGGCVRTASQLLKGDGLLPPCAETAHQVSDLLTQQLNPAEQAELQDALDRAWTAGDGHAPKISAAIVRRRVEQSRDAAQPGKSRTRNDLTKCIAESPGGLEVLRAWCQHWADGHVPMVVAHLFTQQVLRPLKKPNGKARPIALLEVLLKLASGVIQDEIRKSPSGEGAAWNQYGSLPAGPELMLMVGQGLMNLRPDLAFTSLDFTNAFGKASRAAMLTSSAEWCKAHCRFLCTVWKQPNKAWVETAAGVWEQLSVMDGAFQGDTSSSPSFSRGMRKLKERVATEAQQRGIWLHPMSLIDDLLLVSLPEHVDELMALVEEHALQFLHVALNRAKCKAYVPQRSRDGLGPDPCITAVEQAEGGLPALGAAYGGEYEAVLGPYSVSSEPARRRLCAATELAKQCAEYTLEAHAPATRQAAWTILQKCVARALQYDIRVLEPGEAIPLALELDKVVQEAAKALAGPMDSGWGDAQTAQLQWPASVSGMGMGSVSDAAIGGRVACLAQCLPTARAHLRRILPETAEADILAAIPLQGAQEQLELLKARGIEVTIYGTIAGGAEPRLNLCEDFQPVRGVLGVIVKALATANRDRLVAESSARLASDTLRRTAARLLSCEGGTGQWCEAIPSRQSLRLNDSEFVSGLRHRLGLPQIPQGSVRRCQLSSTRRTNLGDDDPSECTACGQLLDPFLDHALCCSKGGGFYRVHGAIARAVTSIAQEAGCEVSAEEVVPELLQGQPGSPDAVEARLDLHIWTPGPGPAEWWVDVTHHHAWGVRYREGRLTAGRVARDAEKKKVERYGPGVGGVAVTPAAMESWGRLGPGFDRLLRQLEARWAGLRRADASAAAATSRRWRAELGIAQTRALHVTLSRANRTSRESEDAARSVVG